MAYVAARGGLAKRMTRAVARFALNLALAGGAMVAGLEMSGAVPNGAALGWMQAQIGSASAASGPNAVAGPVAAPSQKPAQWAHTPPSPAEAAAEAAAADGAPERLSTVETAQQSGERINGAQPAGVAGPEQMRPAEANEAEAQDVVEARAPTPSLGLQSQLSGRDGAPGPSDIERAEEVDPDAHKGWVGPFISREASAIPRPRSEAIAAARLLADGGAPGAHAIAAVAARAQASDPAEAKLLEDLRYWRQNRSAERVSWDDAAAFLERRPLWPRLDRMRAAAEGAMPSDLPASRIIAFFADYGPQTLRGARLYGEAVIAAGRQAEGEAILVDAWIRLSGGRAEEDLCLKRHGALLKPHHEARYEAMVWRKRLSAARRISKRLPAGWAQLTDALTALHRSGRGVDAKIARVPTALRDHPALAHARLVWRDRKRRRAEAEQALRAADKAGELGEAGAWARYRMKYARDAFEDGRHAEAAAMAGAHGLEAGVDFADLAWFAGWMQLDRLGDPGAAIDHFGGLWKGVVTPISRSRAAYWAGAAAAASGDGELARLWWERGAALASAFYGQMAAERLGVPIDLSDAPAASAPFDAARLSAPERELLAAADLLYAARLQAEGRLFMRAAAAARDDAASLGWLARWAAARGDLAASIRIAQRAFRLGTPIWSSLFPIPAQPDFTGRQVEPALLLAIARQESRFMRGARSGAGAIGLMQMMPRTARATARRVGVAYEADRLNADWAYNLDLADAHMAGVLERYEGSYVLSIAAYNAGEGNVDKWIKRFGDPRDPDADPIRWIESIPFAETRNYVQRVLEAAQIYRMRLGVADAPQLRSDLRRRKAPPPSTR
ncbi:MAG: transglycosylase SLT domain-containing protein [Pseudomonadota bacterium]